MNAIAILLATNASEWSKLGLSVWFFGIAFCGVVLLAASAIFGHGDHDVDHDLDHDHEAGHESGGSGNLSFFSFRILVMFVVGFGCAGFFGSRGGLGVVGSSLVGIGGGLILGLLTFALMDYLYRHQGSSAVKTRNLVGREGLITVAIAHDGMGEIVCEIDGSQVWVPARSVGQAKLPVNTRVRITEAYGSMVTVEPVA